MAQPGQNHESRSWARMTFSRDSELLQAATTHGNPEPSPSDQLIQALARQVLYLLRVAHGETPIQ